MERRQRFVDTEFGKVEFETLECGTCHKEVVCCPSMGWYALRWPKTIDNEPGDVFCSVACVKTKANSLYEL